MTVMDLSKVYGSHRYGVGLGIGHWRKSSGLVSQVYIFFQDVSKSIALTGIDENEDDVVSRELLCVTLYPSLPCFIKGRLRVCKRLTIKSLLLTHNIVSVYAQNCHYRLVQPDLAPTVQFSDQVRQLCCDQILNDDIHLVSLPSSFTISLMWKSDQQAWLCASLWNFTLPLWKISDYRNADGSGQS